MTYVDSFLHLASFKIPIESAVLTGVIPDPDWCDQFNDGLGKELGWTLEIITAIDPNIDTQPYAPILTTESLACPTRHWRDFEDTEFSWSQPKNDETGEYHGILHTDTHDVIKRATVKFLSRKGRQFRIQWCGVSDLQWPESPSENVEFSLATTATFSGIIVSGNAEQTQEAFRARLDRYLDSDDFQQSDMQLEAEDRLTGVKRLIPRRFGRRYRGASCTFRPK